MKTIIFETKKMIPWSIKQKGSYKKAKTYICEEKFEQYSNNKSYRGVNNYCD